MQERMRKQTFCSGLLGVALVAAASAAASSSTQTARPALALVHRAPLVVRGAHFRSGELVRLTATAGTTHAAATATTTRAGRLVARFRYTPPICLRLVVLATGRSGDHAKLVVKPQPGPTDIPCGV
jgi:hypothetical protein